MPYASHRIAGVLELEPTRTLDESISIATSRRPIASEVGVESRRIGRELANSRSIPQIAFEPSIKVDSATLQRELDGELARYLARKASATPS